VPPSERILISTATYNERDNLAALVAEIHQVTPDADILVIDDNSPDGTGQLADQLAAGHSYFHVVHRAGKLGLGTAIIAGMRYAIEHGYTLFVNLDADFSHHPRYLPALLAGMADHDVMIGSRYIPGGGVEGWPLSRRLMSGGVNVLVRLLMHLPARDCSGGYRCYRVSRLEEIDLDAIISRGYSFQEELLYRCRLVGCKIGEAPIVFADRRAGRSKVNLHETVRSLGVLFYLGIPAFFGVDRLRRSRRPSQASLTHPGPSSPSSTS
jgi:dolichol-phosphate mannosyltransferase